MWGITWGARMHTCASRSFRGMIIHTYTHMFVARDLKPVLDPTADRKTIPWRNESKRICCWIAFWRCCGIVLARELLSPSNRTSQVVRALYLTHTSAPTVSRSVVPFLLAVEGKWVLAHHFIELKAMNVWWLWRASTHVRVVISLEKTTLH